jgi:hypothetical protein
MSSLFDDAGAGVVDAGVVASGAAGVVRSGEAESVVVRSGEASVAGESGDGTPMPGDDGAVQLVPLPPPMTVVDGAVGAVGAIGIAEPGYLMMPGIMVGRDGTLRARGGIIVDGRPRRDGGGVGSGVGSGA